MTFLKRSLVLNLSQVAGELEQIGDRQKPGIRVFGAINIFLENRMVVLEVSLSNQHETIFIFLYFQWESSPVNDVYADAVVTVILKTESGDCPGNTGQTNPINRYSKSIICTYLDTPIQVNNKHVRECLQETLKDMYGATMVTISEDQQQLFVTIDEKKVTVDLESFVSLIIFEVFLLTSNVLVC